MPWPKRHFNSSQVGRTAASVPNVAPPGRDDFVRRRSAFPDPLAEMIRPAGEPYAPAGADGRRLRARRPRADRPSALGPRLPAKALAEGPRGECLSIFPVSVK